MRHLKEFTLPRDFWLRGESDSYLLRESDGKMCCFGIYLTACGYDKKHIKGLFDPSSLKTEIPGITYERKGIIYNSSKCSQTMENNDCPNITEEKRECLIIEDFEVMGIKVNIVDTK